MLVAVKVAAVDVPTSERIYFQLWQPGQSPVLNYNWAGAGAGTTFKDAGPFLMHPNQQYQATLSSGTWQYGEVKFNAPAGYSIWINDRPTATFQVTSNPWLISRIELRADNGIGFLPAGEANPPSVADLVWAVSAGTYANGLSAGSVQLRASAISSAFGCGPSNTPQRADTRLEMPPTSGATTGTPALIASMMETGTPSDSLVLTSMSTGASR